MGLAPRRTHGLVARDAPPTRCGRCRQPYAGPSWEELEVIEHLVADHIRGLVTRWPAEVSVEIRRCRACGSAIARKQAAAPPGKPDPARG